MVKEQDVDGVVDHDDAEIVNVAGGEHTKVNGDAHAGINGQGRRQGGGRLFNAFRGSSTGIGLDTERRDHEKEHQTPRRRPTHKMAISTVHFNDWV